MAEIDYEETKRHVQAAFDWFVRAMTLEEWERRKAPITDYINDILSPTKYDPLGLQSSKSRITFEDDRFAWYLYLADKYVNDPPNYEVAQGSRVIPFLLKIGQNIPRIESIGGLETRLTEILNQRQNNPDAGIFELLVALNYLNNGWGNVDFISETPVEKSPDLHAWNDDEEWYVECKRMSKSSQYSLSEREKWLKLWQPLGEYLRETLKTIILDVVFHVELSSLEDDYLKSNIIPKLDLMVVPGVLLDNDICTISVRTADMHGIEHHFRYWDVKLCSTQLRVLITGEWDTGRGCTPIVIAKSSPFNRSIVSEVTFAAAAIWSCDADAALCKKARDIKWKVIEATEQIPNGKPGVIHVGLESLDGAIVEKLRYEKMLDATHNFSPQGKEVHFIYCHIFDPIVPPDKDWDIGETVHIFSDYKMDAPLRDSQLVVPRS